jgi:hypothetical protein
MADSSAPLTKSNAPSHTCVVVVPGHQFTEVGDGHYAAHVSLAHGPMAQHSTGHSPHFNGCKDGYNTTTLEHAAMDSQGSAVFGVSFYNQDSTGKLVPRKTADGQPEARIHQAAEHGLTYNAVIPAGSTTTHTIHWATHDYNSDEVAKVHAVANLDKPFRNPEKFESASKKGTVFYKVNDEDPCVAQRIFAQNPAEMAKLKKTTISAGKPTDGTYFEVPSRLDKDVSEHVSKLRTAHEILSKTSESPGIAFHIVGASQPPKFARIQVTHSFTPFSQLPKAPTAASEYNNGTASAQSSASFDLKPVDGTEMPKAAAAPAPEAGGDDDE